MDDKLLVKKIQALLHDPPEKPIILGKIGHENRAKAIIGELIEKATVPDEVRQADHIASAADRINFPKGEHFVADFCRNPFVIHPLSGKGFDLGNLAQIDIEHVAATVDRCVREIVKRYPSNIERTYLSLWREMLDLLAADKKDEARLGQLWELLPADTRIPDHAIWEHRRVTSAIAGALPKPAFLLFTIGPVQDFIATARKTQDLWAGSYLLAYLSWKAIEVVVDEFGPDSVIFPDLFGQPFVDLWLIRKGLSVSKPGPESLSSPSFPNRFLAILPEDQAGRLAEAAKAAVKEAFGDIAATVKTYLESKLDITPESWDGIWTRQTADVIEIYWAYAKAGDYSRFLDRYRKAMGLGDDWEFEALLRQYEEHGFAPNIGTVYGQMYRLVEKALGARKSLRDFQQQTEPSHKCTLCGVREPLHPGIYKGQKCSESFGALSGFWKAALNQLPPVRKSERLCAVCATKRFSSTAYFRDSLNLAMEDHFPSVAMMATASFKRRVLDHMGRPKLDCAVKDFVEAIKAIAPQRWKGAALPMLRRASKDQSGKKDFVALEGEWLFKTAFDDKETLWAESGQQNAKDEFLLLLLNAKKKQDELYRTISDVEKQTNQTIGRPSSYYAVLLMDGDNMGKWLSGEIAPKIGQILHPRVGNSLDDKWTELKKLQRPLSPSLHLAIGKALRNFALLAAREIVENDHLGKLVYAGGDDVLALVSLEDLPKVMRKLRVFFSGGLTTNPETSRTDIDFLAGSGFIPVDEKGIPLNVGKGNIRGFIPAMGTTATASTGVVIAHHSSNFSWVLHEVRECEKKAKKTPEKNAFCIALAKRAGGTQHITARWYYKEDGFETVPLLTAWSDAFFQHNISPKFAYKVKADAQVFDNLPHEIVEPELLRVANRQRNKEARDFGAHETDVLIHGLMRLHLEGMSMDGIAAFLSLAAFLGREDNR